MSAKQTVIDAKFPIQWLVGSAAAICIAAGGVMMQLRQLSMDMQDVKITLAQNSNANTKTNGRLDVLEYRLMVIEKSKSK